MSSVLNFIEDKSVNEANEHEEWRKSIEQEYKSIIQNKTQEFTLFPKGK